MAGQDGRYDLVSPPLPCTCMHACTQMAYEPMSSHAYLTAVDGLRVACKRLSSSATQRPSRKPQLRVHVERQRAASPWNRRGSVRLGGRSPAGGARGGRGSPSRILGLCMCSRILAERRVDGSAAVVGQVQEAVGSDVDGPSSTLQRTRGQVRGVSGLEERRTAGGWTRDGVQLMAAIKGKRKKITIES